MGTQSFEELWRAADATRRSCVGDCVHLRGLIEISNYCTAQCTYCGIRAPNSLAKRYRMSLEEILPCARLAERLGYGTVVLQGGESAHHLPSDWVRDVLLAIRRETNVAITLSLGERPRDDYKMWFEAGAERYLLRFETSNPQLFANLHPGHPGLSYRLKALGTLREIGFEVGSGIMVGVPGQTWSDWERDIEMFRELDLDMIGVGPFLPHPHTPLGRSVAESAPDGQVPNDVWATLRTIAEARLACPYANIPSTTALAALDKEHGHELGLSRGANVIMPNLTPDKYRRFYEIYPSKASTCEEAEVFDAKLKARILALGRTIGVGAGTSENFNRRR
ncbi:MAG: [FeFe] hydrogenase H-cluster radical SAM maturase HydE [Planctomycetia bacterium]|nr:[FeFe] hydrogenase H-cluster radical SAM maturase HydE [Planctomycetia bacterium]